MRRNVLTGLLLCFAAVKTAYSQSVTINLNVVGLNVNQLQLNDNLDSTCTALAQLAAPSAAAADLLGTCNVLTPLAADDTDLANGLSRLIPEETFSISDVLTDAADLQVTNVHARINTLRARQNTVNRNELQTDEPSGGGGASASIAWRKIDSFFNSQFSTATVDGNRLQQDADLLTGQFSVGADYRHSDNFITGAGIGLFQHSTDFTNTAGGTDVTGVNFTLFGTYSKETLGFIDIVLDFGRNSYNQSRQINIQPGARLMARSDTTSSSTALTVGVGKNFRAADWDVSPYLRFGLTSAEVDGYSETTNSQLPGFGSVLGVASQSVASTRLAVGANAAKVVNTAHAVLIPQLSFELQFQTEEKKDPLSAFFLADPNRQAFTVAGEERDTSYLNLGIGGLAVFKAGRTGYLFYETRLAHDFITQHWLKAGFRLEF